MHWKCGMPPSYNSFESLTDVSVVCRTIDLMKRAKKKEKENSWFSVGHSFWNHKNPQALVPTAQPSLISSSGTIKTYSFAGKFIYLFNFVCPVFAIIKFYVRISFVLSALVVLALAGCAGILRHRTFGVTTFLIIWIAFQRNKFKLLIITQISFFS